MTEAVGTHQTVYDLIKRASRVITPLSPINIFAARHPWANMEEETFEEVARSFEKTQNINLYPSESLLTSAIQRGEIQQDVIENKLAQWLKGRNDDLNIEIIEQYCKQKIMNDVNNIMISNHDKEKLEASLANMNKPYKNEHKHVLSSYIMHHSGQSCLDILNAQMIKWCKLYLDDTQSGWSIPKYGKGFYKTWNEMAHFDPALNKLMRHKIKTLPLEPIESIYYCLNRLGMTEDDFQTYLEAHLLSLPGWAGMLLWKDEQLVLVTDYLAIRLSLEWALISDESVELSNKDNIDITPIVSWIKCGMFTVDSWLQLSSENQDIYISFANDFDHITRHKLLLEAWEDTYEHRLKQEISSHISSEYKKEKVEAQLAFCIDTRSEPFRRQLEMEGPFETIGIAGFFGLPIEKCELGQHHTHNSLPVMNKPQHKIYEYVDTRQTTQYIEKKKSLSSLIYTFKKMKQNVLPSLLLPELTGPWLSLQTISRSFAPKSTGWLINQFNQKVLKKPETKLSIDRSQNDHNELPIGFTKQEKIIYVREALKLMNLTEQFASLVVICGHGSHSANNPYASSLDCGACGGSASGFNAKVLATLCNLPEVRAGLIKENIIIPEETVFIAAEHCTTVDDLQWVYVPELTDQATASFEKLKNVLPTVSRHANRLRLEHIPGMSRSKSNSRTKADRLSSDWSEIRPEWGLARNAAFIIGQRALTEQSQLDGRAFLHNYDWTKDLNGEILNTIMSGPATVAQWINLQYYASTVAPHYYGSGNKITQTVTGGIGVMQGNGSDLLTGLPWQSVMKSDEEYYHAPIRLLVVIQAPNIYIENLLNQNKTFRTKVENDWLLLSSIDEKDEWHKW
ncbi:DUF2309 domain-containing protein [Mammaliicoccus vitulinus]|uniref:DUF2309 domain-containing protein n=1 Tax=Mammaliicoccus vitulinus TaxID=71237 RepID=UPI0018681504|nr:putative inorganic carbon transporter subunit DabA [Mammaliicoccus vitulinus]